jgi:Glycosyl transferase family 2
VRPEPSSAIPAYNAAESVSATIDSVLAQDVGIPFEVVIVDRTDPAELREMGTRAQRVWRDDLTYGQWCRRPLAELEGLHNPA